MSKILKNNTASAIFITDTGVNIPASSQYTIPSTDYLLWVSSVDVVAFITGASIVVNDGSADLTATEGVRYLQYPDRISVQSSDVTVSKVVTTLNFTGAVVTDDGNGKTTVAVTGGGGFDPNLIVTHERNAAGSLNMSYDSKSGTHIAMGPLVVVDNNGNVVITG